MKVSVAMFASVAWLACLACPVIALGQTPQADAERLFREGQKLMEDHHYGEACPKFEAAYKKDSALGTLLNLAFCHKEQGATWYAWLEFREAEVKAIEANRPERREFARARLPELEKSLHKMVIDNPQHLPLTDVFVEERHVPEAERGAVFAVESGSRKFSFRATGKRQVTILVTATTSAKVQHVTVPEMEDRTADDLPPPVAAAEPRKAETPAPPRPAPLPVDHTQRTLGWVGVGVGGAVGVLGVVTGAISLFGPCGHSGCSADQRSNASTTAAISTVSFIAAGALVVTGIVLVVTAPSGAPSSSSAQRVRTWRTSPFAFTF